MDHSSSELFSLQIDPTTKSYLNEAAKWGKLLAIVGFVFCGLIVVGGVFAATALSGMNQVEDPTIGATAGGLGALTGVMYIIFAALYFFPCLFPYRFSARTKSALIEGTQEELNEGFRNLKRLFKFVGILTIISLVFFAIALIAGIGAASMV